ncbi:MFS transporter [Streptomyces ochraceiscleroticus]|uniref:MFS transporter n=1 Tax=Streptomyces ochraceiscleroticus TaxID=47761 RepID=A0ABW1MQ48_9ACTN|nr:MFS transporter [Streptomyces ochraceiscleroticus]
MPLNFRERTRPAPPAVPRLLLPSLVLAVLGYQINATMLSPALPDIARRLDTSSSLVGLSQTLFFLLAAVGQVTLARLSDYRGRKPVMLLCGVLLIIGNLACALAPDISVYLAGRILQGVSAAMFSLSFLTLNDLLPPAAFGRAAGIISAVNGGFAGVDAIVGGRLADTVGFRAIFLGGLVLSVVGTLAVARYVPAVPPKAAGSMDWLGAGLLALGLSGVLIGLAQGAGWGWTSPATLGCVVGGLAALVAFVLVQRSRSAGSNSVSGTGAGTDSRTPAADNATTVRPRTTAVIDIRLLASRRAWPLLLTVTLTLAGAFGALALTIPLFTQDAHAGYGLSATRSALLYATPASAIGVIGAPLAGYFGPRVGWRRTALVGSAGSLLAFAVAVPFRSEPWVLFAALAVLGLTYNGISITALNGLAVVSAPKDQQGALTGLTGACFGVGASLGTALASGLITSAGTDGATGAAAYTGAFVAALALLALAMVTALAVRPVPADEEAGRTERAPAAHV